MIQLIIDGTLIPLLETSVRFEFVNNLFNDSFIQGDYTFPFGVADTEASRRAFKYANALDLIDKIYEFEGMILYNNQTYQKGKILVNGYENYKFNVNVAFGIRANNFIDKKLTEYAYGGVITPPDLMLYAKATATTNNYKIYPCCFIPHSNPNFYVGSNDDFNGVVNKFDVYTKEYFSNSSANVYNLVPWFYLFYILNAIAEAEGYNLRGSFLENPDAAKIVLYNNYALDQLEDFYTIFIVKSNNQHLNGLTQFVNFIKDTADDIDKDFVWQANYFYVVSAPGLHNIDLDIRFNSGYINLYNYPALVDFNIVIELNGIDIHTVAMNINNFDNPSGYEMQKFIFFSFIASPGDVGHQIKIRYDLSTTGADGLFTPVIIRPDSNIFIVNNDTVGVNVYTKSIDPRNHVPSDTVGEFFNNLKQQFGLLIEVNPITKFIRLDLNKNSLGKLPLKNLTNKARKDYIITIDNEDIGYTYGYKYAQDDGMTENNFKKIDPRSFIGTVNCYADLGSTILPGKVKFVRSTNKYYIVSDSHGTLIWAYLTDRCDEFVYGSGANEVKSKYMPIFVDTGNVYDSDAVSDVSVLMPALTQSGSSAAFGNGISEATPRLLFNHGLRMSGNNPLKKYPFGSSSNYDQDGNRIAEFSLWPGDDDGLHPNFVRAWLEVLMGRETIEIDFDFTFADLLGFSANEPIYLFNQKYMVKSASCEIEKEIGPFKMYLVKHKG